MENARLIDSPSSPERQAEALLEGIVIAMDFEIAKKS
jgi:hypothetical protein